MNLFTKHDSSQDSISSEHLKGLDAVDSCSETVRLLQTESSMKITGGKYTEIYTISETESQDEQVTVKQRKKLKNKKIRKGIRRAIGTSWKWLKRGFAGYSPTANWACGFSVNSNDIYKAAYSKN